MEQVKLLMTELSPELTRLCAETLAAQDIAVTVCEKDGAKALAALSAEKPDAVLLDASELDFEQSLAAMKKIIAERAG